MNFKRKNFKLYIWYLVITVLNSCTLENEVDFTKDRDKIESSSPKSILINSVLPITIDFESNKIKIEKLYTSKLVDQDHKLIKLETTDESLIGEITKVVISNGRVYVLDSKISKKLFCFDIKGKFLKVIGVKGDGPGEIDTPLDFDTTDNFIYLIDRRCKVIKYDLDGNYKSEIKLPFNAFIINVFDDNNMFFYSHDNRVSSYYLNQINQAKKLISSDFKIQSEILDDYGVPKAFSRNGQNSLFLKFLDDTVYNLSPNGIFPKYIINYPKRDEDNILAIFKSAESINKFMIERRPTDVKISNNNFAETNTDFTFTAITGQGLLSINYYNKVLKKSSPMFVEIREDLFLGGMYPTSVGVYGDYFIHTIAIEKSISKYERLHQELKSQKNELAKFEKEKSEIIKLIKQSKEDDNPILLLTKINPKIYEN